MKVLKFGGSSVAHRDRIDRVCEIVKGTAGKTVVVVSALGKTTDRLIRLGHLAESGEAEQVRSGLAELAAAHRAAADGCDLDSEITPLLEDLTHLLEGVRLMAEQTPRSRALLVSFGERLAIRIVAARLRKSGREAVHVDSRELIRAKGSPAEGIVDEATTRTLVQGRLPGLCDSGVVPVVTGFLASDGEGTTLTLGRGGSDYSATLLGAALDAEEVQIWTDVPGILSADPRLVGEAHVLPRVTYREAAEMSYFGARVLHPKTILPVARAGIPVRILSSFEPDMPGTTISGDSPLESEGVKTVSSVHDLSLITVEGRGLAGRPGIARRIFEVCEATEANVLMISQASSEQSVSFVIPNARAELLLPALDRAFELERQSGAIESIRADGPVAIASIVGRGMAGTPGISGRLFAALGEAGVNILAIAQGASELSISVAVAESDALRAVRAAHNAFGLTRIVHLVLIGCGRVGKRFLAMLDETRERMETELGLELRLIGVSNSKATAFDPRGISGTEAPTRLAEARGRLSDADLIARLKDERVSDVILVDVTAAPLGGLHQAALDAGFHVVTANKVPLSGPLEDARALMGAWRDEGGRYGFETTFGAGLPALHTLHELVHTGDRMLSLRGCLSGTLGFLCTRLQEGVELAAAVREAAELGYTEPDPREDLSGRDVARKALIIARAAGIELNFDQVELEPFVEGLEIGLEPAMEAAWPAMKARLEAAAAEGRVLRYIAEVRPDGAAVKLVEVPRQSAIGSLLGPDNILVFRTGRYDENPLVIRGPGAGTDVTAAGVLGDVLKMARR